MEITSNIFLIGGPSHSHPSDAQIFLIRSDNEAAMIDCGTGEGTEEVLSNMRECSVEPETIKYLFLTHCHYDHTGGANLIRQLTGCKVVAHLLDSEYIENGDSAVTAASWYRKEMEPSKVDIKIRSDREVFKLGDLEVIFYHTPGHSPGSSVLTVKSDGKTVLFGQDIHGPLNPSFKSNREDYINSLNFMLSLKADILCEGHFGIFRGKDNAAKFIESYL